MRRLLVRTAGMACAAALVGILGCATKNPPPTPGPTGSPDGGKGVGRVSATVVHPLAVDPKTLKLVEGKQHPEWRLSSDWPPGSCMMISIDKDPLEPGEDPPGGPCKSVIRRGVPKAGTGSKEGTHYKYTVTVKVPGAPQPEILDPDLEVDK